MLEKELVWLTFRFLHCYFINIDLLFCLSIHILIYLLLSFLLHVSFQLFIHLHIVTFYLYFLINNLVIYLFICLSNFWCLFLVLLFQVVLCVYRLFICTLNYFYFSKESILCLPVFTLLCLFLWIGKKRMMPYISTNALMEKRHEKCEFLTRKKTGSSRKTVGRCRRVVGF